MACVFVYVVVLATVGPEHLGRDFGVKHDNDMVAAAGRDGVAKAVDGDDSGSDTKGGRRKEIV